MEIDFDLEKSPLEIKTDSELGSKEKVKVKFLSKSAEQTNAGGITFYFTSVLKYWVWECSLRDHSEFQTNVPTQVNKVWRITLSRTSGERRVVVHCNEVEVLNVVLSNTACRDDRWTLAWSKDVSRIQFLHDDKASDLYRPEPGMQVSIFIQKHSKTKTFPNI